METFQSRINTALSHLSVLLTLFGAAVWLSGVYIDESKLDGDFSIDSVNLNINYISNYLDVDGAIFKISLNASNPFIHHIYIVMFIGCKDLTKNFHYNCKQINLHLIAYYETDTNPRNEVLIYDKIIRKHENHIIKKKKIYSEYILQDDGHKLRGTPIKFKLLVETIPYVGFFRTFSYDKVIEKTMPNDYINMSFN